MTTVRATDAGLLLLRVGVGGVIFTHGALKLSGWFGEGGGLQATAAGFDHIGFTPGKANAVLAGVTEAGGGVLLAAGLATPAAAAACAGTLAVAASVHAPQGWFFGGGGLEFPATLTLVATALGVSGAGALSVDHLLGGRLDRPWMRAVAVASIAPAAAVMIRRRAQVLKARAIAAAAAEDTSPVPQ